MVSPHVRPQARGAALGHGERGPPSLEGVRARQPGL